MVTRLETVRRPVNAALPRGYQAVGISGPFRPYRAQVRGQPRGFLFTHAGIQSTLDSKAQNEEQNDGF
jgi:hypothetical protein